MKQAILINFPFVGLIAAALILFLCLFFLIVFWTFRKGSKEKYRRISHLPVEGGNHVN